VLLIFVLDAVIHFFFMIHQQMESSKEQLLFGIKIFCNIIKVFTATFDEFIAPLVNKVYKKNKTKKT